MSNKQSPPVAEQAFEARQSEAQGRSELDEFVSLPPLVVKVGGRFFNELFEQSQQKHPLLHALKNIVQQGRKVVLVHGGGDQVQAQLKALNMFSEKRDGLRVTPFEHMPTVAGVLSGYLNKSLVTQCTSIGLVSVGISLADGGIAKCEALSEALGAVGSPAPGDASLINSILEAGMLPIIASVGSDGDGKLYNVNADHAASCLAQLISGHLLLLSDVSGVLDASNQKIEVLSPELKDALIADKTISDGMIVKVNAAQDAATLLQRAVSIGSWNELDKIVSPEQDFGTQILPLSSQA